MCGIVGYMGSQQAVPILMKGLHRLEYRGYDSAGIALINDNGDLSVYKSKGKVSDLEKLISDKNTTGTIGIAHTRWATHGEPNEVNAHPHYSEHKNLALIHNGIIENYKALKMELMNKGYHFYSDTDTEVLIQLVQYMMDYLIGKEDFYSGSDSSIRLNDKQKRLLALFDEHDEVYQESLLNLLDNKK